MPVIDRIEAQQRREQAPIRLGDPIPGDVALAREAILEPIERGEQFLTEIGQVVFRHAEDIFSIGQDLMNTVKGRGSGRALRLTVGIVDVVPKLLASRLLEATFRPFPTVRLVCWEDKLDRLLADLAIHGLDLVIADTPTPPTIKVQAHNHLMGESGVTFFASA